MLVKLFEIKRYWNLAIMVEGESHLHTWPVDSRLQGKKKEMFTEEFVKVLN